MKQLILKPHFSYFECWPLRVASYYSLLCHCFEQSIMLNISWNTCDLIRQRTSRWLWKKNLGGQMKISKLIKVGIPSGTQPRSCIFHGNWITLQFFSKIKSSRWQLQAHNKNKWIGLITCLHFCKCNKTREQSKVTKATWTLQMFMCVTWIPLYILLRYSVSLYQHLEVRQYFLNTQRLTTFKLNFSLNNWHFTKTIR